MSLLIATLLGLIQGLTEFLPVSSSAHLQLFKMAVGAEGLSVIFDLCCHLGTLLSMLWFFRAEIYTLFFKEQKNILYLAIALLPLVPIYFFSGAVRKAAANPQLLGFFLMGTGAILLLGQRIRFKKKRGRMTELLFIGTMQSAALIPGISRSASTISTARALGWEAKDAVRFSFLLAIPTIMGGNLVEIGSLWKKGDMANLLNLECVVGLLTSFFVGLFVIRFAIRYLEKGNMKPFAWYCLAAGLVTTLVLF